MKALILKYSLVIVLVLESIQSFGQTEKLVYYFPPNVNIEIDKYLDSKINIDKNQNQYLVISSDSIGIYTVKIQEFSNDNHGVLRIINSTNRFYQFESHYIPIIYDYDFKFLSYGKDSKGRHLRNHLIYEYPYIIKFSWLGKIISNSR